jgi:hypothetical protein
MTWSSHALNELYLHVLRICPPIRPFGNSRVEHFHCEGQRQGVAESDGTRALVHGGGSQSGERPGNEHTFDAVTLGLEFCEHHRHLGGGRFSHQK